MEKIMTEELTEERPVFTMPELMMEYATQTAKTSLELYLTEGLTVEDYSMSYQIFNEAILYIQRKRGQMTESEKPKHCECKLPTDALTMKDGGIWYYDDINEGWGCIAINFCPMCGKKVVRDG